MIRIGIIGYGYWGPNLVRNFSETSGARVGTICDRQPERLSLAQVRYPAVEVTTDHRQVIADPRTDAIVVATPVSTHFELALSALQAGKHVLVEKPLSLTAEEAKRLIEEAEKRKLTLMVDHTFIYTSAVQKIHELVEKKDLGEIYYYDSVRINLGLFQHDVNVVWDLAAHDLSIMDYVLGRQPSAVSATGISHVSGQLENIAYLTLFFPGSLITHIHVNWLSPVKVRRILIGGSKKMVVYDDLEVSEKVKVYDRGITITNQPESVYQMLIGYRTGDMWAPQLEVTEALEKMSRHFVHCVEKGQRPESDGAAGWRVVRLLEAATRSIREKGKLVELTDSR